MRTVPSALLSLAGALVAWTSVSADQPPPWVLPRDREIYLMEDNLVYARFLRLARDGTYCQINRDEHGSAEVDRGRWEQDTTGTLRLHSSCHALRHRALVSGPLSVTLTTEQLFDGLPLLLASMRHFLAAYRDAVFDAGTMSEINRAGAHTIRLGHQAAFERCDLVALATRVEAALASERDALYLLEPVKNASRAVFALQGSVFSAAEFAGIRRTYRLADGSVPPFYFTRVEAGTFAAEVGRWQPLHLPGGIE